MEEKTNSPEYSHFTIGMGELNSENDELFIRVRDALREVNGVKVVELINVEDGFALDVFTNQPLLFQVVGRHLIAQLTS